MTSSNNHPTKTTGKRMWLITWLIGMGLVTFYFMEQEKQWQNPNTDPESATYGAIKKVVLKRNIHGHYITSGYINETKTVFLLDTGATDVVIPQNVADKLNLKRGYPSQAITANGVVTVYATHVDSVQIGDIVIYDVAASINPRMSSDVLLGMSALKKISFSQSGNELTLIQQ